MNLTDALPRGEQHWKAHLTPQKVRAMRALRGKHKLCIACIAKLYRVNYQTAYDAITGRTWAHVTEVAVGEEG